MGSWLVIEKNREVEGMGKKTAKYISDFIWGKKKKKRTEKSITSFIKKI